MTRPRLASILVAPVLALGLATASAPAQDADGPRISSRDFDVPAAVRDVLVSIEFRLDAPYRDRYRKDGRDDVVAGRLLVLDVDPDLVVPLQTAQPVLYVGGAVAERVNVGVNSGRLVVIVPSRTKADGTLADDLAALRAFFGTPELPERVDAARIAREGTAAAAAGVAPVGPETRGKARVRGGGTAAEARVLRLEDRDALRREAMRLVRTWAPDERALADAFLVPERVNGDG